MNFRGASLRTESPTRGSRAGPRLPRRRVPENGARRGRRPGGSPLPPGATRVPRMAEWGQPGQRGRARGRRRPGAPSGFHATAAPGAVSPPAGSRPRLGPRTIGLWAGAAGCATGRAGSLRGELRATPGARPLTARLPSLCPIPPSVVSWEIEHALRCSSTQQDPTATTTSSDSIFLRNESVVTPSYKSGERDPLKIFVGTQRGEESQAIKPTNGPPHPRNSRPGRGPPCTSTPNRRKNFFPLPLAFVSGCQMRVRVLTKGETCSQI